MLRSGLLLIAILLFLPVGAEAQQWRLDLYAGEASFATAPASVDSRSGVLGLRYNADRRFFTAAAALPLSDGAVAWGVVGAGDRFDLLRRGGLVMGGDLSLMAHGQRDPLMRISGQGFLAEFLPHVSHPVGQAVVEVRSGPRWYRAWQGDAHWTRSFWSTELVGRIEPSSRLRLEGSARSERGGEGEAYTRAGLSLAAALGPTTLFASAGKWIDGLDDPDPEWALSLAVPVLERAAIFGTARRETFDPHFLSPPRTSWGVGVTVQLGSGGAAGAPRLAGSAGSTGSGSGSTGAGSAGSGSGSTGAESAGSAGAGEAPEPDAPRDERTVVLRVPLRDASAQPSIAGDFTGWEPLAMERHGTEWRFPIQLPPGVYRFAFRDRQGEWFVPEGSWNRVDDGMGGWVAVLVVP